MNKRTSKRHSSAGADLVVRIFGHWSTQKILKHKAALAYKVIQRVQASFSLCHILLCSRGTPFAEKKRKSVASRDAPKGFQENDTCFPLLCCVCDLWTSVILPRVQGEVPRELPDARETQGPQTHPKSWNTKKAPRLHEFFSKSSREFLPSSLWHDSGNQQKLFRKTCSDDFFLLVGFFPPKNDTVKMTLGIARSKHVQHIIWCGVGQQAARLKVVGESSRDVIDAGCACLPSVECAVVLMILDERRLSKTLRRRNGSPRPHCGAVGCMWGTWPLRRGWVKTRPNDQERKKNINLALIFLFPLFLRTSRPSCPDVQRSRLLCVTWGRAQENREARRSMLLDEHIPLYCRVFIKKVSGTVREVSGESPESVWRVFLDCPRDFLETFWGPGAGGPGRHFWDFLGFRARRARETSVRGGLVPKNHCN